MRKWLVLAILLFGPRAYGACQGSSPAWTTAGGTEQDIADCVTTTNASLLDGDTVTINYTGTITISNQINISKAITLKGLACTLSTVSGKTDIPSACPTVLSKASGAVFEFTLVATKTTTIQHLEFTGTGSALNLIGQGGNSAPDSRRYVIQYVRFNQVGSINVNPFYSAWGVTTHSYVDLPQGVIYLYPHGADYDNTDERWAETTTDWNSDKWNFVEDSVITCSACTAKAAVTDGYGASKVVVRYNHLTNVTIENHGTETGRQRGGKAIQAYQNTATIDGGSSGNYVFARSGGVMAWGNTLTGYVGTAIANLLAYRIQNGGWGNASGENPWDVNDGGNPQTATLTAASDSTNNTGTQRQTVTTSENVTWTADQWVGYVLKKSGCDSQVSAWQPCSLVITANTAASGAPATITYGYINAGQHLDIAMGEQFYINKITHMMDGPCRKAGTNLAYHSLSAGAGEGMSRSGTTVTVTMLSHGLDTTDYVYLFDNSQDAFNGVWKVATTPSADTFTFEMETPPAWSSSYNYSYGAVVTYMGETYYSKIFATYNNLNKQPDTETTYWDVLDPTTSTVTILPAGWNDQTTDPCYQWLNTMDAADVTFEPEYSAVFTGNDVDADYFDYDDDKTIDGQLGPSNSSIGTGNRASRPGTCDKGFAWWSTDQGGNWDTLNGDSTDGTLDRCTATNTWTDDYYTPYTYPHPLVGASITLVNPDSGTQGDANLSIAVTGFGTSWSNGVTAATFSGTGITVDSTTCASATACTVVIDIAADATASARTLTMTTTAEVETSTFTVNASVVSGGGGHALGRARGRVR